MSDKKIGVGFGVMLLRDGNVLLGKRHEDPEKADSELHGEGTWTMPGGKLEFKEEPKAGAVRELREETGMETATDHLELISVSNDINGDAHFVTLGFMCHECSGEPLALEPDEITVWEWFPLDALPEHVFPPSLKIIKNYQDGAVYKH